MINIIIPAYNCSTTLGRTLASLVAQTDQNFETIIVDDFSTENIQPIVNDYDDKLSIRYIRHDHNQGCGMSRQTGIDNVSCSHFMFCDADDILMPYVVETFNEMIKAEPDTEYVHTFFYEQTVREGRPAYILHQDGFVWCHGKLYSAEAIKRYDIHEDPSIHWADDSVFNSQCSELLKMKIIRQPMYIWTNTKTSAMRKKDDFRDREVVKDFLKAMIISCEHVRKYKDTIEHLQVTLGNIEKYVVPGTEEAEMFEKLKTTYL